LLLFVDGLETSSDGFFESSLAESAFGFAFLHDLFHRSTVFGTEAYSHGLLGNLIPQTRVDLRGRELSSDFLGGLTERSDTNGFALSSDRFEDALCLLGVKVGEAGSGIEVTWSVRISSMGAGWAGICTCEAGHNDVVNIDLVILCLALELSV